jgi:quinol monooxygenase YgiN
MYGTIAKLSLKPGSAGALQAILEDYEDLEIDGMYASYLMQSETDPNVAYVVAIFDDKESYRANADSPEQHQRYLKMREQLTADPEWHDGTYIASIG